MIQKTSRDEWMTEDDIKIIQGALYTSLLTPDVDGLYRTPLMQAIAKLRNSLKNEINVDLPTIRFIDNTHNSDGMVADNEIAISVNKTVIWKTEMDAQNIEACDTAVVNELRRIMECRN